MALLLSQTLVRSLMLKIYMGFVNDFVKNGLEDGVAIHIEDMYFKYKNGYSVFDGAAAGEVGERGGEALDDRAGAGEAGELLEGFVEDVAGVEVWDDENVGLAGDGAFGGLLGGDLGIDGSV